MNVIFRYHWVQDSTEVKRVSLFMIWKRFMRIDRSRRAEGNDAEILLWSFSPVVGASRLTTWFVSGLERMLEVGDVGEPVL